MRGFGASLKLSQSAASAVVAALLFNVAAAQQTTEVLEPAQAPNQTNSTTRGFGDNIVEQEEDDDSGLPISIGLLVALCIIGGCLLCCCYALFHACIFYRTYGWVYEWAKWGKDMVFGSKDDTAGDGKPGWAAAPWNSGEGQGNGPAAPWSTGGGAGNLPSAGGVVSSMISSAAPWSRDADVAEVKSSSTAPASATEAAKPEPEP